MSEEWRTIPDFPRYDVSSLGRVRNIDTGRIMQLTLNQRGIMYVGLMKDGCQYKRSVALLVAASFLNIPIHESFDSVIYLDGDRRNCAQSNLMWRPLHFAINYQRQFTNPPAYYGSIYCPDTDETFPTSRQMAVKYGLLERDILKAMVNGWMVWPTKMSVQGLDGE